MSTLLERLTNFNDQVRCILQHPDQLWALQGDWEHQTRFASAAKCFNLRFNYKPWFIVYCKTTEEVRGTYLLAIKEKFPIRIRSGGHDHEAECSGDDTVLIDVSCMDSVSVDGQSGLARIGPGNKFTKLTSDLADVDVMLPHGTCGSVAIAGFTMGAGWGPWTRKYGMCCERLMGATMVLANGEIVDVDTDPSNADKIPALLWALRGGGGMSYGLVTELRIQTFPLPALLIRFKITWNPYDDQPQKLPTTFPDLPRQDVTTLTVLKTWEKVIEAEDTGNLIGTNLMISGCPLEHGRCIAYDQVYNNCIMFGYWEGTEEMLRTFVSRWFADAGPNSLSINPHKGGTGSTSGMRYGEMLMSDWHRQSTTAMLRTLGASGVVELSDEHAALVAEGKPLPPDHEDPAPHKITSRLVNKEGLCDDGYRAYIETLWSPLILSGNRQLGLTEYTTLGAITGDYYREYEKTHSELNKLSSFPYKDKLYTIQYQTWWNQTIAERAKGQESAVYKRTNRAMDWIEMARDAEIPNTTGAFISFKDSSVPTETYFAESYKALVEIKKRDVDDPDNHFRIRKSII